MAEKKAKSDKPKTPRHTIRLRGGDDQLVFRAKAVGSAGVSEVSLVTKGTDGKKATTRYQPEQHPTFDAAKAHIDKASREALSKGWVAKTKTSRTKPVFNMREIPAPTKK